MRVTERYRRRDFGRMELETIIEEPAMYTGPWSILADLVLQADTELLEFICEENEKDSAKLVGKQTVRSPSGSRAVRRQRSIHLIRAQVGGAAGEIVVHAGEPYSGIDGH